MTCLRTCLSEDARSQADTRQTGFAELIPFEFGFAFLEGFRYLGIESLSECKPILKIFATKS